MVSSAFQTPEYTALTTSIHKTSPFGLKISSASITAEDSGASTDFGEIRKTLAHRNIEAEATPTLHIPTYCASIQVKKQRQQICPYSQPGQTTMSFTSALGKKSSFPILVISLSEEPKIQNFITEVETHKAASSHWIPPESSSPTRVTSRGGCKAPASAVTNKRQWGISSILTIMPSLEESSSTKDSAQPSESSTAAPWTVTDKTVKLHAADEQQMSISFPEIVGINRTPESSELTSLYDSNTSSEKLSTYTDINDPFLTFLPDPASILTLTTSECTSTATLSSLLRVTQVHRNSFWSRNQPVHLNTGILFRVQHRWYQASLDGHKFPVAVIPPERTMTLSTSSKGQRLKAPTTLGMTALPVSRSEAQTTSMTTEMREVSANSLGLVSVVIHSPGLVKTTSLVGMSTETGSSSSPTWINTSVETLAASETTTDTANTEGIDPSTDATVSTVWVTNSGAELRSSAPTHSESQRVTSPVVTVFTMEATNIYSSTSIFPKSARTEAESTSTSQNSSTGTDTSTVFSQVSSTVTTEVTRTEFTSSDRISSPDFTQSVGDPDIPIGTNINHFTFPSMFHGRFFTHDLHHTTSF
ncbi:hypothetical protein HPG69_014727 [Diceros bicornis minor]|uniref:Uncharacterized protein n=1 Tax=Diceros bicornis minor TaxID=77932 RepID=A0A7J7EY08_DICBM|nr:hypothetical protein HPG69_014727 [Diceros bicornis minor]